MPVQLKVSDRYYSAALVELTIIFFQTSLKQATQVDSNFFLQVGVVLIDSIFYAQISFELSLCFGGSGVNETDFLNQSNVIILFQMKKSKAVHFNMNACIT